MTHCSTTRKLQERRPRPKVVESCARVGDAIRYRDQFYKILRGKVWVESSDLKVNMEVALEAPGLARMEMTGPMGIRVGMLLMNDEWIQLYVPREKAVFRFPKAEAERDTLRRERFFRLLPLRVQPSLAVDALLTRVSLDEGLVPECEYDDERNAYRLRFKKGEGGRLVWVDPTSYAPLEIQHFTKGLPPKGASEIRPDWRVVLSAFTGSGPSTLPSRLEFFSHQGRQLLYEWNSAEAVPNLDPKVFQWQPPASLSVRDY